MFLESLYPRRLDFSICFYSFHLVSRNHAKSFRTRTCWLLDTLTRSQARLRKCAENVPLNVDKIGDRSEKKMVNKSIERVFRSLQSWISFLLACCFLLFASAPARAASSDTYVRKFLRATEPVAVPYDAEGSEQTFSPKALARGKKFFSNNCLNCHVGGTTLPNPLVSLSLADLAGATPPRDNIEGLVAYMRFPTTYDGSDDNLFCREITERWLPQEEIEELAAFILVAADRAPGWAVEKFEGTEPSL